MSFSKRYHHRLSLLKVLIDLNHYHQPKMPKNHHRHL
jgi:hypothetical protein